MASVTATFEIRNDRSEEHDGDSTDSAQHDRGHGDVSVSERRRREVTASRDLEGAEDAVWAIEAEEYEIVWDLWEHVEGEDFDEWGFRSPYPSAEVDVSLDYKVSIHDVVWYIAQRQDAEPAGVYLSLIHNSRIYGDLDGSNLNGRVRGLTRYLEAVGVDLSYWTHGHDHLTNMDSRSFPDAMIDHAEGEVVAVR